MTWYGEPQLWQQLVVSMDTWLEPWWPFFYLGHSWEKRETTVIRYA